MEKKEVVFGGVTLNGFLMLFAVIVWLLLSVAVFVLGVKDESVLLGIGGALLFVVGLVMTAGFVMLEPGEARLMMFFGAYRGTFSKTGFYWVNPFITTKKLSLRARNLDAEPIKVNDQVGNPVMIGLVLVWKLCDTYKAMFEIDAQTMAKTQNGIGTDVKSIMDALEQFVKTQSDAALRQVAGQYAYDDVDGKIGRASCRERV